MDRYYIYIAKSYTRVYKKENGGKPLEFDINGIKISDIPNLVYYDFLSKKFKIMVNPDIFRQTFLSPFSLSSQALGYDYKVLRNAFFRDLFDNYLKINKGEIVVIPTVDLLDLMVKVEGEISLNDFFKEVFTYLKPLGYLFDFKGAYINRYLKENIIHFLTYYNKKGFFFMDDELYICVSHGENGISFTSGNWKHIMDNKNSIEKSYESVKELFSLEGIDLREEIVYDLLNHMIDSYFLDIDNRLDSITIKDKIVPINYKKTKENISLIINDIYEDIIKSIDENDTKVYLNESKYIFNVTNKTLENKLINYLTDKGAKENDIFSYDDVTYKMLLYTDMVMKYNAPIYKKFVPKEFLKSNNNYIDGILYEIGCILSNSDIGNLIKYLELDENVFMDPNKDKKKKKRR